MFCLPIKTRKQQVYNGDSVGGEHLGGAFGKNFIWSTNSPCAVTAIYFLDSRLIVYT